jgi:hypothetical protein
MGSECLESVVGSASLNNTKLQEEEVSKEAADYIYK